MQKTQYYAATVMTQQEISKRFQSIFSDYGIRLPLTASQLMNGPSASINTSGRSSSRTESHGIKSKELVTHFLWMTNEQLSTQSFGMKVSLSPARSPKCGLQGFTQMLEADTPTILLLVCRFNGL